MNEPTQDQLIAAFSYWMYLEGLHDGRPSERQTNAYHRWNSVLKDDPEGPAIRGQFRSAMSEGQEHFTKLLCQFEIITDPDGACHELKTDPEPFQAMLDGAKRSDVRDVSDKDIRIGDYVVYREFDRKFQKYTERVIRTRVLHIQSGYGLPDNIQVISFQVI